MSKVCLIANVGQRDLQLDGQPISHDQMRGQATTFLNELNTYQPRLSMPMLSAALKRVQSNSDGKRIDAVILAATDQADEKYRQGDTEPAAQVLKKLIEELQNRPACVVVAPIRDAPNSYDRMLDVYRREIVTRKPVKDAEQIYVLCTGGTPACNTALLLASVEKYRDRVTALYVNEKTSVCTPLQIGEILLDGYRRAARDQALTQYDFAAIANDNAHPPLARHIARAASARANFDFDTLDNIVANQHSELEKLDASMAERLVTDNQLLSDNKPEALLRELFWNAHVRWHREEYADFLGRVWRMCEMAYQLLLREVTGIDLDGSPKSDDALRNWINGLPWLQEILTQRRIEPRQSMKTMEAILKALRDRDDEQRTDLRERIAAVLQPAETLQGARDLRNKSIIAHGFKGLSKSVILENLGLDEAGLWETIRSLLTALSVEKDENPYEHFAALLRKADS